MNRTVLAWGHHLVLFAAVLDLPLPFPIYAPEAWG